jgi:HlyD family secretion protein
MTRFTIGVAALVLAAGCGRGRQEWPIVTSGQVEATEVRVSTKVGGVVAALHFEEGDAVKAGQALVEIDTTDTRLALDAARGEHDQAAADLKLRLAGSRAEDIADGEAQVARAASELAGAQKDLERMEGLLASGSGTTKGKDDARVRCDMARAALDSARERLRKLRAGSRPEEIEAARARAAAGAARVAQLDQQLKDATIVSPLAGMVTEKLTEAGELASRGTALAVVTDLANPWLTVYVAEPDLSRIRLGQAVEVVTDDRQKRRGAVSFIASSAEFTPKNVQTRDERVKLVYRVKVRLPNEDALFKTGMPAEARILADGQKP